MSDPILIATVQERDRIAARIRTLPVDESHEWEIVIRRKRDRRSSRQLRLYWRWLRMIASDTGMTPEAVDFALRMKYAPLQVDIDGETMVVPGDISGFDVKAYGEYLDWAREFIWTEYAIDLPLPIRELPLETRRREQVAEIPEAT